MPAIPPCSPNYPPNWPISAPKRTRTRNAGWRWRWNAKPWSRPARRKRSEHLSRSHVNSAEVDRFQGGVGSMKHIALAGFAAGAAMMVGGALGAVSHSDPVPDKDSGINIEMMNPMIAGQAMLPDRDIMENISASPMHSTMMAALKDSGVGEALKAYGEITVFAPTNAAFSAAGVQPHSDKSNLGRRLSYLIVPGP